jgi:4-hydroxy-tetrahydrodipicolinate reductase
MGRLVVAEIEAEPDLELAEERGADVVIDFTSPDGLRALLTRATGPVVSGTTGVALPEHVAIPFLHAPNFSLGVAVLARLVRQAHAALPDWDVEVVELHHRAKADAPSGTALRLVEGIGPIRVGRSGARLSGEVGAHAVRGGDIVGEHVVYLVGDGERLQLGHVAHSRSLFAKGAVRCARWLVGKPPGRYGVEEALGGL